jgi:hypothetical protein
MIDLDASQIPVHLEMKRSEVWRSLNKDRDYHVSLIIIMQRNIS